MPTARELLDQADALMRRNRPAAAAASGEEGIPTLMDVVPALPASARAPHAEARDPVSELADVPLLTDAVEEIEAPSILDEPPEEDDPQAWTDTLTGAHTIIPALAIDLPAPVAQQPPVARQVGVLPEEWTAAAPFAPQEPLAVETIDIPAPSEAQDDFIGEATAAPAALQSAQPIAPAAEPADLERPAAQLEPGSARPAAEPAQGEPAPSQAQSSFDSAPSQPFVAEQQPATPFEWPSFGGEAASAEPAAVPATDTTASQAPVSAEAPAGESGPSAAAPPDDEARWHALAEEIRMQVLQRIDLFTDTGLREQLAARLQPIVDRAGADLVATINQHVGVLLRAYVAEAIEREIERWRADGR